MISLRAYRRDRVLRRICVALICLSRLIVECARDFCILVRTRDPHGVRASCRARLLSGLLPSRVEISLSFLISNLFLVGPGLEFPHIEKTVRGAVSTRLVFLGQKKLIGALSGASEEFLVLLNYGKSICIWRSPD